MARRLAAPRTYDLPHRLETGAVHDRLTHAALLVRPVEKIHMLDPAVRMLAQILDGGVDQPWRILLQIPLALAGSQQRKKDALNVDILELVRIRERQRILNAQLAVGDGAEAAPRRAVHPRGVKNPLDLVPRFERASGGRNDFPTIDGSVADLLGQFPGNDVVDLAARLLRAELP